MTLNKNYNESVFHDKNIYMMLERLKEETQTSAANFTARCIEFFPKTPRGVFINQLYSLGYIEKKSDFVKITKKGKKLVSREIRLIKYNEFEILTKIAKNILFIISFLISIGFNIFFILQSVLD